MTAHSSAKRARKYHHLTCSNCRRRKTKCDGTEPICTTCKGFGDVNCTYDKPASIAYVRHLEKQVQSLVKELDAVKLGDDHTPSKSSSTRRASSSSPSVASSSGVMEDVKLPPHNKKRAASAFGITNQELETLSSKEQDLSSMQVMDQKAHLTNMSSLASKLEDYALEAALTGSLSFIGVNMAKQLLSYYWSWIHPYQMHIYRPLFFRHMAMFDPEEDPAQFYCYSPALLCMIMAESARVLTGTESDLYQVLDQYAFTFLTQDLKNKSTIASASSCLLLSSRAMALSNAAQCWNFSGMAARIGRDLSIHTPPEQLTVEVSVEEAEARRRLFWGLFNHDMAVSLYQDRAPTFEVGNEWVDVELLDDCFDIVIWDPIVEICGSSKLFITSNGQFDDSDDEQPVYQPNKSSCFAECFKWQSKLNLIMARIIRQMRGDVSQLPTQSDTNQPFTITDTINELEQFWTMVPDQLKISPDNAKTLPHVVSFNLSYHVCFTLLLLPIFQQCPPHVIDSYMIMHSIKAGTVMRQCLASQVALFGTNCATFFQTYSAYLIYQLLQVSLTEFTERPQQEFDRDTVIDNLNFFTRMFKVCAFSLPVVDSTIAFAHNRTRREVAFASQRAASVASTTKQVDFFPVTSFPGSLGISFDNTGPLTRHMSLEMAPNDPPQPPRYYQQPEQQLHLQQQQQRSKSIAPVHYTTQPPAQNSQASPASPNQLQESHYMTFPDLSTSPQQQQQHNQQNSQQRSLSYGNAAAVFTESWNPYVGMPDNFDSPSPRSLQTNDISNLPISTGQPNIQWQEPERGLS